MDTNTMAPDPSPTGRSQLPEAPPSSVAPTFLPLSRFLPIHLPSLSKSRLLWQYAHFPVSLLGQGPYFLGSLTWRHNFLFLGSPSVEGLSPAFALGLAFDFALPKPVAPAASALAASSACLAFLAALVSLPPAVRPVSWGSWLNRQSPALLHFPESRNSKHGFDLDSWFFQPPLPAPFLPLLPPFWSHWPP